MKVPVSPFLTAPAEAVDHGGWHLATPEGDLPLPLELDHWDYQTTLALAAAVRVDRAVILDACKLRAGTHLALLITAHSDFTRTERPIMVVDLPGEERTEVAVQIQLPGTELGGRLTLRTLLVATSPVPDSDLAPDQPGSVLWSCQHRCHLQGTSAQFPTDASDFRITHPWAVDAGWNLAIDTGFPDVRFAAAVRLTLNSGNAQVATMLGGGTDDTSLALRRTLRWDVTRRLVQTALSLEEVMNLEVDAEATSLAAVLRNVLASLWPHESPRSLRSRWSTDPQRIEIEIQDNCGPVR